MLVYSTRSKLTPTHIVLILGTAFVSLFSFLLLSWPSAIISVLLGALMIYAAEIDARSFLLPDSTTIGAAVIGVASHGIMGGGTAALQSFLRALILFLILEAFRRSYAFIRHREGLGFGDVKLAAAIGAWLHISAIPYCFLIASGAGLIAVLLSAVRNSSTYGDIKIPFGTLLCPSLWLLTFASLLDETF